MLLLIVTVLLFHLSTLRGACDIIERHFALTLAKLHFYVDYAVGFFVGKHYNRLHMQSFRHSL